MLSSNEVYRKEESEKMTDKLMVTELKNRSVVQTLIAYAKADKELEFIRGISKLLRIAKNIGFEEGYIAKHGPIQNRLRKLEGRKDDTQSPS